MAKLRAGVIGIGAMGRHHARIMRDLEGVDLVAVADPGGDRFGVAPGFEIGRSVQDLIDANLDMAIVAVPTAYHEEVAIALAEAGVATMVEKPVAFSVAAARRVQDAFETAGVVACVGHVERFNPAIAELRRRVQDGELGRVYQVSTTRFSAFPTRIGDVGVVKDLATHDINTTQWIAGTEYGSVAAHVAHQTGREHEDVVSITARMTDGVLVNHQVNWLSPMKVRLTTVIGERGTFTADTARVSLSFWANASVPTEWEAVQQFRGVTEGDMTRFALRVYEPLKAEDEAFRDAVLGIANDAVPLSDGVKTLEVAEAVLRSAETGTTVRLDAEVAPQAARA